MTYKIMVGFSAHSSGGMLFNVSISKPEIRANNLDQVGLRRISEDLARELKSDAVLVGGSYYTTTHWRIPFRKMAMIQAEETGITFDKALEDVRCFAMGQIQDALGDGEYFVKLTVRTTSGLTLFQSTSTRMFQNYHDFDAVSANILAAERADMYAKAKRNLHKALAVLPDHTKIELLQTDWEV